MAFAMISWSFWQVTSFKFSIDFSSISLTQSFTKIPMIFKTLFMGLNLLFHTSYKREGGQTAQICVCGLYVNEGGFKQTCNYLAIFADIILVKLWDLY